MVLLSQREIAVVVDDKSRLSTVPQDSVIAGKRQKVVHQSALRTQSPKWCSTHLVGGVGWPVLHNTVTGIEVVQQEVAVRVNGFAA